MARTILLVEDEPRIRAVERAYLENAGYRIIEAANGPAGLDAALEQNPDLVVLDLMLPGLPGEDLCRQLRAVSTVPIIMVTARGEESDRIDGLHIGADDYLAKPFSPRELVARVEAVLRRTTPEPERPAPPLVFAGGLEVDRSSHQCRFDGEVLSLTASEFKILAVLAARPGQALSRLQAIELAFGYDYEGDERTVDVHVKNLRRKLERAGAPGYLETVYGVGYRFVGERL